MVIENLFFFICRIPDVTMTLSHSYITPGRELKFDFLFTIFAAEPFYISTLNVIRDHYCCTSIIPMSK